jgi:uncharacterized protein
MKQPALTQTKRPDVVVIGASCRAVAQCAAREGFRPCAMDAYVDRDLLECAEAHPMESIYATESIASDHPSDRPVPSSRYGPSCSSPIDERWVGLPLLLAGGMENDPEGVDRWIAQGLRCGVNGSQIRVLRDPVLWRRWADASGLRTPETLLHTPPGHGLFQKATCASNSGWLCKTRQSAGGMGVSYYDPHQKLCTHEGGGVATQNSLGCYWQRRVPGLPVGVTMISCAAGTQCLGAARAIQSHETWGPTPFAYRGSIGPWTLDATWLEPLAKFGETVRVETGLLGLWQADFIVDEQGLWLLEINPRWSASMELLADTNRHTLIRWHLAALRGESIAKVEPLSPSHWLGKSIVYSPTEVTPETSQLEALWRRRWNGWSEEGERDWRVADIPNTCATIPTGVPIATCMASGRDPDELIDRLRRGEREILALLNLSSRDCE